MLNALIGALALATAAGWEMGERAPEAPAQLEEFEFLVGCFRIDAQRYRPERNDFGPSAQTYWNGRWALNGWAIYDEWFDVQIPGQPPALGRGANLRLFNPETGIWTMVWAHTSATPGQDLRAQMRDGEMVMWQVHPIRDDDWKAVFRIVDDNRWVRTAYTRPHGTDTWIPQGRLSATQVSCDTVRTP